MTNHRNEEATLGQPDDQCPHDESSKTSSFLGQLATIALTAVGVLLAAKGAAATVNSLTNVWRRRLSGQSWAQQPQHLSSRSAARPRSAAVAAQLAALARAWMAKDPDPATRAQVAAWVAAPQQDEIKNALARLNESNRLRFGTAGLRAEMGPGYDRMNAYNVIIATQAVLQVMRADPEITQALANGVAIGFDGRYNSEKFAAAAAAVFVAAGVPVRMFSRPVPTPLVAFSVPFYKLAGGIVITASHNPPADNGYKLYWADGSQIRPPRDKVIEAAMRQNPSPRAEYDFEPQNVRASPLVIDPTESCLEEYIVATTQQLKWRSRVENNLANPIVYTACHGVGYPFVSRLFSAFGLSPVIPVEPQTLTPDPSFPTLPKPNPEEMGAMDLSIAKAKSCGARLVLANDPDADRLGMAEIDYDTGSVHVFSGDETAVLFADYVLSKYTKKEEKGKIAMLASTVSSKMLANMARIEGFVFQEELTGFKWISKGAAELRAKGLNVVFAYEEAIGFMLGDAVLDKDGVSAAAVAAEMAAFHYTNDTTLVRHLSDLWKRYGYHLSCNGYLKLSGDSTPLDEIFAKARTRGFPEMIGECNVMHVRDLTMGTDTSQPDGKAVLYCDPLSQFVTFTCQSPLSAGLSPVPDLILSLRGSGTEPKVKHYAELRCTEDDLISGTAKKVLDHAVSDVIKKILEPSTHKLDYSAGSAHLA